MSIPEVCAALAHTSVLWEMPYHHAGYVAACMHDADAPCRVTNEHATLLQRQVATREPPAPKGTGSEDLPMRQAHGSSATAVTSSAALHDAPAQRAHSSNGATASSSHAAVPAPGQAPAAASVASDSGADGTLRPAEPGGSAASSSARETGSPKREAAPQHRGGPGPQAGPAEHTAALDAASAAAACAPAEHAAPVPAGVAGQQHGQEEARAPASSTKAEGSEAGGQQAPGAGAPAQPEQWEGEPAWLALDQVYYGLMVGSRQLVFRLRPGQPTWLVWEVRRARWLVGCCLSGRERMPRAFGTGQRACVE